MVIPALRPWPRSLLSSTSPRKRLASTKTLNEALREVIPVKQEQLKAVKAQHGQMVIGNITVDNVVGGMQGMKAMLCETSALDPIEGIRFRGLTIQDCRQLLPSSPGGKEIIPESMLWLLLTGQVPSPEQTRTLSRKLAERSELPSVAEKIIDSLPPTLHPMTQLGIGVAALNHDSSFRAAYEKGLNKSQYWIYTLEDSINLIARLPVLAARIYRNIYHPDKPLPPIDTDLDFVGNYARLLGFGENNDLTEYLRLYMALHADHDGGNASAHTAHLVGSTLADPFLAYSASLFALAGPRHGLANQEALRWQLEMQMDVGNDVTYDRIKQHLWTTLNGGQVVPGYGHGVLRDTDPRFIAIQEFCDARPDLSKSPIIRLIKKTYEVAPDILKEHGKIKNPYPNVDANSGCVLHHYGLTEFQYYTVIFGIARAFGSLTQLVWARALGFPLERPMSYSIDELERLTSN